MEKSPIISITFVVLFTAFLAFAFFEINSIKKNQESLINEFNTFKENIDSFSKETKNSIELLSHDIGDARSSFDSSLKNVQTSVDDVKTASNKQFAALGGQLSTLQVESEEKFKTLEQSVALNLKSEDFSKVIKNSVESVVSIRTDAGVGSGVFTNGYIITNQHVIAGASAAVVLTYDNKKHAVQVIGYDTFNDLAILRIDETYPSLDFGREPVVGQRVIAVGNPGGLEFTVTEGIVSAVNRKDSQGREYVQTDVPINPGNSGGPLIDATGRIVGINTLKIKGYEGIGFAVPGNIVRSSLERIISEAEQD